LYESRLVRFISSHSLWLYLWHILVLDVYSFLRFPENWVIKWLTVFAVSVLIVFLVNRGVDAIEKRRRLKWLWLLRG
jgi:surface polysaccharide O-acyltransferase-like enzyme